MRPAPLLCVTHSMHMLQAAQVQVIVLLLASQGSSETSATPVASYVVVIDCGSSGSRVTAFRIAQSPTSVLPTLLPLAPSAASVPSAMAAEGLLTERVQTTPGLAAAFQADTRWGVRQSLRPLLDWAEAAIPAQQHAHTALLICATAGVRSLPAKDQTVLSFLKCASVAFVLRQVVARRKLLDSA